MNDKITMYELNRLIQKLNLPENLTNEQRQQIALYAAYRLDEQKKQKKQKKEKQKIIFNPDEKSFKSSNNPLAKSIANQSHEDYTKNNKKN